MSPEKQLATVPASKFVSVRKTESKPMANMLQAALKGDTPQAVQENLFKVSEAIGTLMPELNSRINKATLPEIDVSSFDDEIKSIDERIKGIQAKSDAAVADLEKQVKALNEQIAAKREPFSEDIQKETTGRGSVVEARTKALEPQKEALDKLLEDLKQLGDSDMIDTMLEVNAPAAVQPARQATTSSGVGRGRAGAASCTITKGGSSRSFPSVNAARKAVYEEENGESPKWQANSNSCVAFLEKAGYTVELS